MNRDVQGAQFIAPPFQYDTHILLARGHCTVLHSEEAGRVSLFEPPEIEEFDSEFTGTPGPKLLPAP